MRDTDERSHFITFPLDDDEGIFAANQLRYFAYLRKVRDGVRIITESVFSRSDVKHS